MCGLGSVFRHHDYWLSVITGPVSMRSGHHWFGVLTCVYCSQAPRAAARRPQLRAASGHVGCRVHHGGDVDPLAHHAGQHRAAAAGAHFAAVRELHSGCVAGG